MTIEFHLLSYLIIFHSQGFVTREFIASGGLLVIGQSVMAAPNPRLEKDVTAVWQCVYCVKDVFKFHLVVNISIKFLCHILVRNRQEAEPWLSTLSLEGTPVAESELRPGPVKQQKAALSRMDVEIGFAVDQVR